MDAIDNTMSAGQKFDKDEWRKPVRSEMKRVKVPDGYDYIGVYLTNRCHLGCDYCITGHHHAAFGTNGDRSDWAMLKPWQWIEGLNRLELPKDVPVTLQGGEPFLYKGIWDILENINHKVDILTALPPFLNREHFLKLKTLDWNRREAPYPTIRVSYHKGQNDYKELIGRIAQLNDIVSIGLFYLEHPGYLREEIEAIEKLAAQYHVELRKKEFLGKWNGRQYGTLKYEGAACGEKAGINVQCKNTVVPVGPDGSIFRCHSDLYFKRVDLAIGNILDEEFHFPTGYLWCENYGLCNECDIKIKNNHYQQFGYTSVDIIK